MKKPFLNPVFQFLDESVSAHCHHLSLNRMGFDYQVVTPEELPDMDSKVTGSYRGLTLETVEMYKPSGVFVQHRLRRVPVEWVDLVVVPFEGGHE